MDMLNGKACEAAEDAAQPRVELLYDLAELFKVFGDSTRIRILSALQAGPLCVYHLAEALEMGQSAISHQLRILRSSGLVRARRNGKTVSYALDDDHVQKMLDLGLAHVAHRQGRQEPEGGEEDGM